jgi:hypothetical protein
MKEGLLNPDAEMEGKKTKTLSGGFAPSVEFSKEGQKIVGVYEGFETFKGQGGKDAESHRFALRAISPDVKLKRQETAVTPELDMVVALTGKVVSDSMKPEHVGKKVCITYNGKGKKKKGRNPAKLYTIELVEAKA